MGMIVNYSILLTRQLTRVTLLTKMGRRARSAGKLKKT